MGVLRALVDGVWVDVGGSADEVWVGAEAPPDPQAQLWYDTDAANLVVPSTTVPLADALVGLPGSSPAYARADHVHPMWDAMPRGIVGSITGTAAQTGIGNTMTDLTGCSITWNGDISRLYRVTLCAPRLVQQTAVGEQRLALRRGSDSATIFWDTLYCPAVGQAYVHTLVCTIQVPSSLYTVKASVQANGGTIDTTVGFLPKLMIEDVGKA